jgi:hypothetical protein
LWRCGGRRLRGEERGEESDGGEEMEGSHRAALIHRGGREVKRWSYQFELSSIMLGNLSVVWCVEVQGTDQTR